MKSKKLVSKITCGVLTGTLLFTSFTGCGASEDKEAVYSGASQLSEREITPLEKSEKYRTFYEIFVRSFYDSDGDGIGDLQGVTEKLDYLNDGDAASDEDLGVTGIWLMPIMPSDTYHKYDVKDYMAIDPAYGTMEDFDALLAACDERGINVLVDLVLNHTSSAHPWFQEACEYLRSIGDAEASVEECPYIEYYHFTKGMEWGYYQVEGTDWYYEAGFWSEMPDLNLSSEAVRAEFEEICRFWLGKGVAGFRLDAVKEFVSDNTEENVKILSWLNDTVKGINPDAYLVGEAWTSQPDYAKYYASGVDSFFEFSFANHDGLISKLVSGLYPAKEYGAYIERSDERYAENSANYINAPFYSNHDMDRSAGYYSGEAVDAQIKMAAALNLTMSGNAFVYYGDEIGMLGKGKDENKRLGMRWSANADAAGMCDDPTDADWNGGQSYPALDEQIADENSLYQYYKNLIRLRNQFPAIAKGSTVALSEVSDKELCVLEKTYGEETVCILYNISPVEKKVKLREIKLADGTALKSNMLEATLVSGTEPVEVKKSSVTFPPYSVAVFVKP